MAVVADSYGAAKEAGGPAKVAGAGVSDVVIATDRLLRRHGYWARSCAAHDTVSTVGLVRHTGVGTWAHHIGARLCAMHEEKVRRKKVEYFCFCAEQLRVEIAKTRYILLTFTVSLVHDLQVRVSHAAGHQQSALILI